MNREAKRLRTRLRKQFNVPFMTATTIAQAYVRDGGLRQLADSPKATNSKVVTYCQCCGPEYWRYTLPGAEVEIELGGKVSVNDKPLW